MNIHKLKKSKKSTITAYKVMEQIDANTVASALAKDSTTNQPFTFTIGQRYQSNQAGNLNPVKDEAEGFRAYRTLSWARFMRDHIMLSRRDRHGNSHPRRFVVVKVQLHSVRQEGYELKPQADIPTKTALRSRLYVASECEFLEIKD